MVQARLDAEGADGKRVLRAAAIFGERFSRAGLAALLGGVAGIEEVSRRRRAAWRRTSWSRAPSTPAAAGDVELVFAHALVREAAYAMLTDEDRAAGAPAGGRLAGAGRGRRTPWCWPSTSAVARSRRARPAGTSARQRRRSAANDLVAAIERAELGIAGGAAGELAGKLRLIARRGARLARRAGRGGAAGAGRGGRPAGRRRRLAARAGAGDHRRGQARAAGGGRA